MEQKKVECQGKVRAQYFEIFKDKKKEGGEEEIPWLTIYADMMTLLLTFFVFLWSISTPDVNKYKEMMRHLGDALGAGKGTFEAIEEETLESIMKKIEAYIGSENLANDIILTRDPRGVVIYASNDIFFESGDIALTEDITIFLNNISRILKDVSYKILVEGHTDDVPIKSEKFPSNWELSANRASNVVRYFLETGNISPARLIPAGYADMKPRFPATPENRRKNRRVEIIILREKF